MKEHRDGLRPLPWQADLWLELTSLAIQKRLSHALLLGGPAGVGKRHFARALGAFILCEQRSGYACGRCRSCVQIAAGTHPDATRLSVDGHEGLTDSTASVPDTLLIHWEPRPDSKRREISIDAVHSATAQLTQVSHYGGARVVLVEPAELLNESSANALLKLVEEPPPGTHILFIAERPSLLKPTLRSRCQRIRFGLPEAAQSLQWASDSGEALDAEALAEAHGAPLLARELQAGEGLQLRRQWQELWVAVARQKKDPLSAAGAIDKEHLVDHLGWAYGWLLRQLRDATQGGAQERSEALGEMLGEVIEARRRATTTASPQLLLESLLVLWLRLGRRTLTA